MSVQLDVVLVYHREENHKQALELARTIFPREKYGTLDVLFGSNEEDNIGFGPRCNQVVRDKSTAPIVGFLNPDVTISGQFVPAVLDAFDDPTVMVAGERFGKADRDLSIWQVKEWVCGAAFFVRRDWWDYMGGFDEAFVWGWEETDFIKRTELEGGGVLAIDLPIGHPDAGDTFDEVDSEFKKKWFEKGAAEYVRRYGVGKPTPTRRRGRTR